MGCSTACRRRGLQNCWRFLGSHRRRKAHNSWCPCWRSNEGCMPCRVLCHWEGCRFQESLGRRAKRFEVKTNVILRCLCRRASTVSQLIVNWLMARRLIFIYSINHFSSKMSNICWFQLLTCKDLLLFCHLCKWWVLDCWLDKRSKLKTTLGCGKLWQAFFTVFHRQSDNFIVTIIVNQLRINGQIHWQQLW